MTASTRRARDNEPPLAVQVYGDFALGEEDRQLECRARCRGEIHGNEQPRERATAGIHVGVTGFGRRALDHLDRNVGQARRRRKRGRGHGTRTRSGGFSCVSLADLQGNRLAATIAIPMARLFWICVAGALGTGARYLVGVWATRALGASFPYGTLIVNVVGCFLIAGATEVA